MLGTAQRDVFKECKQLFAAGHPKHALAMLRDALRLRHVAQTKTDAIGRFLRKAFSISGQQTLKVHLLGQCTTSWLTTALTSEAWAHGVAAEVTDGGYDSLIQDLEGLTQPVDVLVLLPWHQRLLAPDDRGPEDRIADELAVLRQAWAMLPDNARLVQVGYDWIHPGSLGYQLGGRFEGDVQLVRRMNDALREALPEACFFVDLEQVSADIGHRVLYDVRNYAWTKQPFSSSGVYHLSRHLWSGVRAVTTGPKKVLVLDLDNTIWGGVVGELGPLGIELGDSPNGEAFRGFQRFAKELKSRGVLLAVCSKNNPEDAREPFQENRDMVLELEDVACFEASWDPKPEAITRIAERLNLGLDSFVFFDDSPIEREAVRQQLPMVEVVETPPDPADYVSSLQEGLWFESLAITGADRQRAEQYCAEQQRRAVQTTARTLPEYLRSLEMTATISEFEDRDMQRIAQLLAKTNQFNLTTRRHTAENVKAMLATAGAFGLSLRLRDRFGDCGLVALVIALPEAGADLPTLRLDTWLMSCRAIGRTVELAMMNAVIAKARALGYERIRGEYVPTGKNNQVGAFYPSAGFVQISADGEETVTFELFTDSYIPLDSFVRPTCGG